MRLGRFERNIDSPLILGVVNLTPDSFSDGGLYSVSLKEALNYAEGLLKDGADILDIGGESTRPGALPVAPDEEWRRLKDFLCEVKNWGVPLSIDTHHSETMEKALNLGAMDILNDIAALQEPGGIALMAQAVQVAIILMHMQGEPATMQQAPRYRHVVQEVEDFLWQRVHRAKKGGIDKNRFILDPGIGFGKSVEHNLSLIKSLPYLKKRLPFPWLIGVSRKSVLGELLNESEPKARFAGSLILELAAISGGVQFIRTHEVKLSCDALTVYQALQAAPSL